MMQSSSCMDQYGYFQQNPSMNQLRSMPHAASYLHSHSHQHHFSQYLSSNDWTGVPLIKSIDSNVVARNKKVFDNRFAVDNVNNSSNSSNALEYNNCGNIARTAQHTHGTPMIVSGRFRKQQMNAFNSKNSENGNVRSQNARNLSTTETTSSPIATACESGETHDESGYHVNGTCLPRIIKPRKRRKKDRKPLSNVQQTTTATESVSAQSTYPFTFSPANDFIQNGVELKIGNHRATENENLIHSGPSQYDTNFFFNSDFNPSLNYSINNNNNNHYSHHHGSTSSSPISLSNSSLSSSSCSCRLCDPNCKIWAFPLRRSFSDNATVEIELEHMNANKKKDVGVIGGNRMKVESNLCANSSFAIMDLIEFNHNRKNNNNRNPQYLHANTTNEAATEAANKLRSESLSDSGDSGCELLLSGLNISDGDIISSTIKTVNDAFTIDSLNGITQQLSHFNLIVNDDSMSSSSFNDNSSEQLNYINASSNKLSCINLHANDNNNNFECTTTGTVNSTDFMCKFSDHRQETPYSLQQQQKNKTLQSDFDKIFAMNLKPSSSGGSSIPIKIINSENNNYNYNSLMSPMLVNKQNFNTLDVNNKSNSDDGDHHDNSSSIKDNLTSNFSNAPSLCLIVRNENDLNERSSFLFEM